jgi:hypothetical protein
MRQPKTQAAQALIAALDAELADAAKRAGTDLVWSAAEQEVLGMLGAAVDRREEMSQAYEAAEAGSVAQVRLATEVRLTEQSISRLFKLISTDVAPPMSQVSLKAQRAARSRWDRERMKSNAT